MRKLILQMQSSVDGFVCGPDGEMNWVEMNWGPDINAYVTELSASIDCILLGHGLAQGFIPHWQMEAQQAEPDDEFSKLIDRTHKIVFTRQAQRLKQNLNDLNWRNTEIAEQPLAETVKQLKEKQGKNIMVYGGVTLVRDLVKENLIDEYYLFINPVIIGRGAGIFQLLDKHRHLQCSEVRSFDCGVTLLKYIKS